MKKKNKMSEPIKRTPERLLIIGCTSFAGLDSIAWTDHVVPNIPDYDRIIISVPHMTEDFLATVKGLFLQEMRQSLLRFLHSGGKMIVLVSPRIRVERPSKYPESVSNVDCCPIWYGSPEAVGKRIKWNWEKYASYL
jgi:hypothetical protein